ncbi:MAG: P-loop NTPase fold protein [Thermodesulfobacteriota bacterium]
MDTLGRMIKDKDFKTPFCIGIFGKWGSGKTSFMHLLEKRLSEDKTEPHTIPVWFNPWRYEKEEHLIIPFLKTIEHEIARYIKEQTGLGATLSKKLKATAQKIGDASAAFAYGISSDCKLGGFGFGLDTSAAASREEDLAARRVEEAKKLSDKLSYTYYDIVDELKSAVDEKQFRIVVFVDDLDRCLPDKAVELLEAIKLFLDIEGYLFLLGVDREVVKKGISYHYRFFEHREEKEEEGLIISPEDYLDKMIQLPLELPAIEPGRKRRFIESLMDNAEGFTEHADIIETGVGENPRTLKRFINLLAFTIESPQKVITC